MHCRYGLSETPDQVRHHSFLFPRPSPSLSRFPPISLSSTQGLGDSERHLDSTRAITHVRFYVAIHAKPYSLAAQLNSRAKAQSALLGIGYGDTVDLVHGRMRGPEKDRAMERFAKGETRLLVATTVIEVGVDVPRASVMVIEHAERFGLAQLHQLRGRIGRGAERSSCILLYKGPLGPTAKARLAILRETDDGFRIAEEDLRLRGQGDVLGVRQSGLPGFRVARIESHAALLPAARDDATLILARDPKLQSPRGQALRQLLYLFSRDEVVSLLSAG